MLVDYFHAHTERRVEEVKLQAQMSGFGGLLGAGGNKKNQKYTKEEAERLIDDPLLEFPNDIEYLTEADVNEKIRFTEMWRSKNGGTWRDFCWDDFRAGAALGEDPVARRAAQNDILWEKYLELRSNGIEMDMGMLRKLILFDAVRSRLYPNTIQLQERHNYERKNKLPMTVVDPAKPPPDWFTQQLQASGELEKILGQMRVLCSQID